ncbi:PREDICTED: small integral membrane protein 13-like [Chrysochloris asiatica]|uniref:Small integral membrane protein 13-like n=1 Tax=Chrysochloris asiatica TaxID=185453 RepID=A0A9B0U7I8_CHRAS|nr:PREDICTED: small integral membrane protein 13-like [Chrysochloris asiatica]
MWHDIRLMLLVLVAMLLTVLLMKMCGWYFVWHLLLSKFKLLQELEGDTGLGDHEPSELESGGDTASSQHRIRFTSQRRAIADEGHWPQMTP